MKIFRVVAASFAVVLLLASTGCLRVAPKMPKTLASPAPITYAPNEFQANVATYRADFDAKHYDLATDDRNRIAYRVMAQIEAAYSQFESTTLTSRAGLQTGGDAAQLGLTAAATVVGAAGVKDILDATAIALQGTRLSFDKNFFEQKTTEALISQMRATRKTQEAQLLLNLNQRSAKDYTLEQTWTDLIRYYHAGTISSALVDIASKAGADDVKAGQTLATVQSDLIKNVINIRQTRDGLAKDIGSSDPAVAAAATAKLTQIVTALNLTATPRGRKQHAAGPDDVHEASRRRRRQAGRTDGPGGYMIEVG